MTIPIIICDDSSFARKQMARALPAGWNVSITFASNGQEAINALRQGLGDILFLDLTMPQIDGFTVLETIRREDLPTLTIVVSGDIQPDSQQRVMALGAIAFLKKPVQADEITPILRDYGLLDLLANPSPVTEEPSVNATDRYQEVANVAMGRAADLLAKILHIAVTISIPKVEILSATQLVKRLEAIVEGEDNSLVSQGFIASGIGGETLLIFHSADSGALSQLLGYQQATDSHANELVMDVANNLMGAFFKGLGEQLELRFMHNHPQIARGLIQRRTLLQGAESTSEDTLVITLSYHVAECFHCEQLLLFTTDARKALDIRIRDALE
jgi:chemotaxis protein CheY-P-specific phosphatase CheC/ActR/RegA family two-component response regulator